MRSLWVIAIGARFFAAGLLLFGPWIDEPNELDGWDTDRFQQIVDSPGTAYVDFDVEYPPGTVVLIEVLAQGNVVDTTRVLIVSSLLVDLAIAAILIKKWNQRAGLTYLWLGLPLLAAGLLRFEPDVGLPATVAAAALLEPTQRREPAGKAATAVFALATVAGAMIKVWPIFLIPAALGVRQRRPAAAAATLGLAVGLVWIRFSGFDAISQVTTLRGATGWHLESIPGSLAALLTNSDSFLEADAFRIGSLNSSLVTAGRVTAVLLVLTLTTLSWRRERSSSGADLSLVMLAAVSTMLITAPLLSPQFLLWLTPWAAMLLAERNRPLVILTALAVGITGLVLVSFGPPNLDHPAAAAALLLRDALLIAIVVLTVRDLRKPGDLGQRTEAFSLGSADRLETR